MSNTSRTDARRQQVLVAAAECFRTNGFHGASMMQIARAAQMSPGHIYNLFENKEDVIHAIVALDQAQWLDRIESLAHAPDVARALLDEVAPGVEHTTALSCAALRLETVAEAGRNPRLAALVQATDTARRERIEALLKKAVAQQGFELDEAELRARATSLATMFDGLIMRALRDPAMDKPALVRAIQHFVQTLLVS